MKFEICQRGNILKLETTLSSEQLWLIKKKKKKCFLSTHNLIHKLKTTQKLLCQIFDANKLEATTVKKLYISQEHKYTDSLLGYHNKSTLAIYFRNEI